MLRRYRSAVVMPYPPCGVASHAVPEVVIGIPVKPFPAAKRRLASVLDDTGRAVLGRRLAERTVHAVLDAGAQPLVISADDPVTEWARSIGVDVLLDEGSSLDEAAKAAVGEARRREAAWGILHADLPLLRADDLQVAVSILGDGGAVVAPSSDGGTSLVGSSLDRFAFSYGPGSFHRHLAALAREDPRVIFTLGLALDLDTP
ncbi:MAG: 2-phospho-L-lactate guanylyltransferase, partial [Acidimicrobiia bacterium]